MNWNKFKLIVDILTDGKEDDGLSVENVLDIFKYLISDKIKVKLSDGDCLIDVKIKGFKCYMKLKFGHWVCGIYDLFQFDPLGNGEKNKFNFQLDENGNLDKLCGYYCLYFLFCFNLN